jgi:hypothetical protein
MLPGRAWALKVLSGNEPFPAGPVQDLVDLGLADLLGFTYGPAVRNWTHAGCRPRFPKGEGVAAPQRKGLTGSG